MVGIAQTVVVTSSVIVGLTVFLFFIIEPNCCVDVRVELQGGDGGAVVEVLYLLLVGQEVGVRQLGPRGQGGRGGGGVESTALSVEVLTDFAGLKC